MKRKCINSGDKEFKQFHQYTQNEQSPFTLNPLKTKDHDIDQLTRSWLGTGTCQIYTFNISVLIERLLFNAK